MYIADRIPADKIAIPELLAEARDAHQEVQRSKGGALVAAMRSGGALFRVKSAGGHGSFGDSLRDCGIPARTAQTYMNLAANRAAIEAAANTPSSAHLSIAAALRLIRPKKPANSTTATASPTSSAETPDPYSSETLKALPAAERARVFAALMGTFTDDEIRAALPARALASITQHAVGQEQQQAQRRRASQPECLDAIRTAVATNAPATHQVENIRAALESLDDKTARTRDWRDRMDPSKGRFPMKPGIDEARGNATTNTTATPAKPH
jgi:hypothetical protein